MRIPQSTNIRLPAISTKVQDAPTSSAPPKKVSFIRFFSSFVFFVLSKQSEKGSVGRKRDAATLLVDAAFLVLV
jgi:hypothetical protein